MNAEQRLIMIKVRATWDVESKFTYCAMARAENWKAVDPKDKSACCWCFHGVLTLHDVPLNNEVRDSYNRLMIKHAKLLFPHHDYKWILHDAMDLNDRLLYHNMIKIIDHILEHEPIEMAT